MLKIDGIDPLQANKIKEPVERTQVDNTQKVANDPGLKERGRTLGREQKITREDISHQEKMEKAIDKANSTTESLNMSLRFRLHEDSDRYMVEVVDIKEDEVIKEIPPEKLLNLVAQIQNLIGLLIDTER